MTQRSFTLAQEARIKTVEMTSAANASHVGSGLSMMDILACLYTEVISIDPANPKSQNRDRVIVSKGHAAAAVYAILGSLGFFDDSWLSEYCSDGSMLGGHVTSHGVPGVEFSTGSLGHGLPLGVGVALGIKRGLRIERVFVLCSDGELDEGTTWESALLAAHHSLSNLTLIVDRNRIQSLGSTETTLRLDPLDKKFESFGWEVSSVNGHNHSELIEALLQPQTTPRVVIANTVKGYGVSFMENSVYWHYHSASPEERDAAIHEIRSAKYA